MGRPWEEDAPRPLLFVVSNRPIALPLKQSSQSVMKNLKENQRSLRVCVAIIFFVTSFSNNKSLEVLEPLLTFWGLMNQETSFFTLKLTTTL